MSNNYYTGCKVVIGYQDTAKKPFEVVKNRLEEKYPGVDVTGDVNESQSRAIMVISAEVPFTSPLHQARRTSEGGADESVGCNILMGFAQSTVKEELEKLKAGN